MPGPLAMDADSRPAKAGGYVPGCPGVVEMDVAHHQHGQVVDAQLLQTGEQVVHGEAGTALDQDSLGGVEEVAGQAFRFPLHPCIDDIEVVGELVEAEICHGQVVL